MLDPKRLSQLPKHNPEEVKRRGQLGSTAINKRQTNGPRKKGKHTKAQWAGFPTSKRFPSPSLLSLPGCGCLLTLPSRGGSDSPTQRLRSSCRIRASLFPASDADEVIRRTKLSGASDRETLASLFAACPRIA